MFSWFRTRRRFIPYFCLLFNTYIENCSRFGATIAMIGGMVKKDCDDPLDVGEFCWSERTQAFVIGAYFYGYTAQVLTALIAKKCTGFTVAYRIWLVVAAVATLSYPTFAGITPTLIIVTQALRGFLAGVMIAFNFNYISKFSVGDENKILIPIVGAISAIGQGTGSLIAGSLNDLLGWRYYFYLIGTCYVVGLGLNLLFVHDSPQQYWYMTDAEKKMITRANITTDGCDQSSSENVEKPPASLKSLFCRLYLLAFCIYIPAYNLIYYNLLNVVPFFLNKVLGAEPLLISYLNISLCLLIAISTVAFSFLLLKVDQVLTWIQSRMVFTLVPMVLQIVFHIALSTCVTVPGSVFILLLSAVAASTLFSGSVYTINYEIDPENSAILVSVYNSFGQLSGFLGPILMVALTTTNPDIEDYDLVYRQKWSYFFYVVSGVAGIGFLAIVMAYLLKPDEWINRAREKRGLKV